MDELTAFLISILANLATPHVERVIYSLRNCKTSHEKTTAVSEAKGIIEMAAENGAISLDGALLEALNSIKCDHGSGKISINQTRLKATVLLTGGLKEGCSGSTLISGSILQSNGTMISVGSDASIKITGNATMRQT
jgi:hypothetical protein